MTTASRDPRVSERFTELVERLRTNPSVDGLPIWGVEVPLRICPLGAHIDHQNGLVTGLAVDRSVMMASAPSEHPIFAIESLGFDGDVSVDVTVEPAGADGHWGDYVRAAVCALQERHTLRRGLQAVIRGELAGAGLSSSAAVLIAYLVGLARANGIELRPEELVELVQRAENRYIGVASGLLDQSVMVHADLGSLTLIDCRDLTVRQITAPPQAVEVAVVVAFSGAGRSLVDSGYNNRVFECREAARNLLEMTGEKPAGIPRLRDVDPEVFAECGHRLPRNQRLRATHYFTEMERVAFGLDAWRSGDVERFGQLVSASGESSIVNYECGTPSLTSLYELLHDQPGVYGARFSGGGFGGTCVALASPESCEEIVASISDRYAAKHPELADEAAFEICGSAGPMRVFDEAL